MQNAPKSPSDPVKVLNAIEREVYKAVKDSGFTKHGRTLHRFMSGDISQVIHFQLGQAYLDDTHSLVVNVGIRVPECVLMSFLPEENPKKYYREASCNIRSRLGAVEGKRESVYDLRRPAEPILSDILRQVREIVLPAFDALSSREAILKNRRNYPAFDQVCDHLILREEALIYGRLGDTAKAAQRYGEYLDDLIERARQSKGTIIERRGWLEYAVNLARGLGLPVSEDQAEQIRAFPDLPPAPPDSAEGGKHS